MFNIIIDKTSKFITILFISILDMLSKEPPWSDGEICLECNVKFSIKTRRHHW